MLSVFGKRLLPVCQYRYNALRRWLTLSDAIPAMSATRDIIVDDKTATSTERQYSSERSARTNSSVTGVKLTTGALTFAAFAVYVIAVLRTAWLSDDAFITFRALDNLRHGYGLLSNPPDRVMGFTGPLWAFVVYLPFALKVDIYSAAIAVSVICAVLTAWFIARAATSTIAAFVAMLWLALSNAYVDFSTSGLENPLAHLLLSFFFLRSVKRQRADTSVVPFLLASAISINRMDHVLLIMPALIFNWLGPSYLSPFRFRMVDSYKRLMRSALIGLSPLGIWIVFSIVYYGFPFPNTAYAKLNTALTSTEVGTQGMVYLLDSLRFDPVTLLVIGVGIFSAIQARSRAGFSIAIGLLSYLAYVVFIGGDFMRGRFLTSPFVISVLWLSARGLALVPRYEALGIAAITLVLGLLFTTSFNLDDKSEKSIPQSGIVSERLWYPETALLQNLRIKRYKREGFYPEGKRLRRKGHRLVKEVSNVGILGFSAGPRVYLLDNFALTDPLLARIPFSWPNHNWRIGHFQRRVPEGYARSLRSNKNELVDPCLREYYDVLIRIIRGPIFNAQRFRDIWDINTGRYDELIQQPCRRDERDRVGRI